MAVAAIGQKSLERRRRGGGANIRVTFVQREVTYCSSVHYAITTTKMTFRVADTATTTEAVSRIRRPNKIDTCSSLSSFLSEADDSAG